MKHIKDIYRAIQGLPPKKLAVAAAADPEVLEAVASARRLGIVQGWLFGDPGLLCQQLMQLGERAEDYTLIPCTTEEEAAQKAVRSVHSGQTDILMKGMLPSSTFLKAVLNREYGLREPGQLLCAIAAVELMLDDQPRVIFITDPGFLPLPTLEDKAKMISGSVRLMGLLGYECPKIAILSAMETVNPKMASSTEARELAQMGQQGCFPGCQVGGPFSLDLALSPRAAVHKGFCHPIAGQADLLVMPSLEAGNALLKSLTLIHGAESGGMVSGTTRPVVFTSRSDSALTKRNTIAMATLLAERMDHGKQTI